jgi:hypothetical protein
MYSTGSSFLLSKSSVRKGKNLIRKTELYALQWNKQQRVLFWHGVNKFSTEEIKL